MKAAFDFDGVQKRYRRACSFQQNKYKDNCGLDLDTTGNNHNERILLSESGLQNAGCKN